MQMSSFVICRLAMLSGRDYRKPQNHASVSPWWWEMMCSECVVLRYPTSSSEFFFMYETLPTPFSMLVNTAAMIMPSFLSPRDDVVLFWRRNAACQLANFQESGESSPTNSDRRKRAKIHKQITENYSIKIIKSIRSPVHVILQNELPNRGHSKHNKITKPLPQR